MRQPIAKSITKTSYIIKRTISNFESSNKLDKLSGTNSFIILFLLKNEDKVIFQKDLEKEFGMTRSTASNVLKLMETKKLIKREEVENDHRLKKLSLTELGYDCAVELRQDLKEFDEKINSLFNEQEAKLLNEFLSRINSVLERK